MGYGQQRRGGNEALNGYIYNRPYELCQEKNLDYISILDLEYVLSCL